MPLQLAGMRIEPPWSPPMLTSMSPAATAAPLPLDDAPVEWVGLCGLRTGPKADVWLAPENEQSSLLVLPRMVPPASSTRVTTVASMSGI